LALLAGAVLTLGLMVALTGLSFGAPSAAALDAACRRFALPDAHPASLLALILGSVAVAALALVRWRPWSSARLRCLPAGASCGCTADRAPHRVGRRSPP
jgi:hypothetical protein